MDEPKWILKEVMHAVHGMQLAEHGGIEGVRDEGMLQSAINRPQGKFHYAKESDLASLAAAYAFGLAKNHAFNDGNKRTAAVVCETYIRLNGHRLEASDIEFYLVMVELSESKISEEEFSEWLRQRLSAA